MTASRWSFCSVSSRMHFPFQHAHDNLPEIPFNVVEILQRQTFGKVVMQNIQKLPDIQVFLL